MMDVLKQLKVLTMDLCWIYVVDVVTLSVFAKESGEWEFRRSCALKLIFEHVSGDIFTDRKR